MAGVYFSLPPDYWETVIINKKDLENINSFLFENETPSTIEELLPVFISNRIRQEKETQIKKQQSHGKVYFPKDKYKVGESLVFPTLNWTTGKITECRSGFNPILGDFEVLKVDFSDGTTHLFAANLYDHKLNHFEDSSTDDPLLNIEMIISTYGPVIQKQLSNELLNDPDFIQFATRWFPKALLLDIHEGNLNLAEAILDEAGGKPLSTNKIIDQIEISTKSDSKLLEFSLNYALKNDGRFDEVGPTGEILWFLKRLEPDDVQQIPAPIRYTNIQYDRSILTPEMLSIENQIDDELIEFTDSVATDTDEETISLNFPHWRAGTLPITARTGVLFPSAYESPRVRFTMVDGISKEEYPGWVVREKGYVVGLSKLFTKYELTPGSLIKISRGKKPGQTMITPKIHRPSRDWIRTVLVGSDGGIVFAMLKQTISCDFNERMVIAVPDVDGVDKACEQVSKQRISFENLVDRIMNELIKLNVQGHVHAMELYSAINVIRRCPPGPVLSYLSQDSKYKDIGDLHFRMTEMENKNA